MAKTLALWLIAICYLAQTFGYIRAWLYDATTLALLLASWGLIGAYAVGFGLTP